MAGSELANFSPDAVFFEQFEVHPPAAVPHGAGDFASRGKRIPLP
jgi:hypothetical protein